MPSPVAAYLWPSACPRCNARMSTLDRVALQVRRVAIVVGAVKGQRMHRRQGLRACSWCHKPSGSPKAR